MLSRKMILKNRTQTLRTFNDSGKVFEDDSEEPKNENSSNDSAKDLKKLIEDDSEKISL